VESIIKIDTNFTILTPILFNLLNQLFAYHMAVAKGNNVDQPRNLAKSVTVE
jgi:glutamine---fructose-6-phosphate transaminase (isomerizing)